MREIRLKFGQEVIKPMALGVTAENLAVTIVIDCANAVAAWPNARFSIMVKRPDEAIYPALHLALPDDAGLVYFPVTQTETAVAGKLKMEVHAMLDEKIAKTCTYILFVSEGIAISDATVLPPEPTWVQTVLQSANSAYDAAQNARLAASDAAQAVSDFSDTEARRVEAEARREQFYGTVREAFENGDFVGEQGLKGDKGNVMYATFAVDPDTRQLVMYMPDGYNGPDFRLNYENGTLEAILHV